MEAALAPGFFRSLSELPVVETGAETGGNRLRMFRTLVVAEAVVSEAQGFGEQPALAIVLVQEGLNAFLPIAAAGAFR